tara:strand:+ start:389 stop:910 length:522 start_codon:yes stop_codon:yes gene_type:complete
LSHSFFALHAANSTLQQLRPLWLNATGSHKLIISLRSILQLFINSDGATPSPAVSNSNQGALIKQYQLRDVIQNTAKQFLSFAPKNCGETVLKFLVASQLPRPYTVDAALSFPTAMGDVPTPKTPYYFAPSLPCKSLCETIQLICPGKFESQSSLILNFLYPILFFIENEIDK